MFYDTEFFSFDIIICREHRWHYKKIPNTILDIFYTLYWMPYLQGKIDCVEVEIWLPWKSEECKKFILRKSGINVHKVNFTTLRNAGAFPRFRHNNPRVKPCADNSLITCIWSASAHFVSASDSYPRTVCASKPHLRNSEPHPTVNPRIHFT